MTEGCGDFLHCGEEPLMRLDEPSDAKGMRNLAYLSAVQWITYGALLYVVSVANRSHMNASLPNNREDQIPLSHGVCSSENGR